jgi:hypothetical protein
MKTFKDLVFKEHYLSKSAKDFSSPLKEQCLNAKQAVMDFPNGYGISVLQLVILGWQKFPIITGNVLRLCDGCEALELSVGATCTKPLLYAVLFFCVLAINKFINYEIRLNNKQSSKARRS